MEIGEIQPGRLRLTPWQRPDDGHHPTEGPRDPAEGPRDPAEAPRDRADVPRELAEVAHDLRDPIHTIRLATDVLVKGGVDDGQRDRLLRSILSSSEMVLSMITSLLNGGAGSVALRTVDVRELLEDTRDRFRLEAEQRNMVIDVHVPRGVELSGQVDRRLLDRVLSNLIRNALVHAGGRRITLAAEPRSNGMLRLEVRDRGRGFRPEDRRRTSRRSDVEEPEGDEGHGGYGLDIVERGVAAHGGHLWMESRLGEGTTFFFTIPAS